MKKIINISRYGAVFLTLVLTLIFASCTKLEDQSFRDIFADSFEPTDEDIPKIVGSAYGNWRSLMMEWNGMWRAEEVGGDEVVIPARPNGWVDGGIYRRIHEHAWTPEEDINVQPWNRAYSGITNCNRIIYQIESGFLPLGDTKDEVIAELKVLRASYYYALCDLFGNVPIVTDFDTPEGFLPEQSTRKEVYDFIVKEITDNIDLLSKERNELTYGRFNEWAARTLLAKMYLNAEVYTGTAEWDKCLEQCNLIIGSGVGYDLEGDQKNVFVTENQNSVEIILAIPIDDQYTTAWNSFDIHMQTLQPANQATYNLQMGPWGGMCAIPQFIDTFDPDDSRLTNNFIYGQQFSSSGDSLYCTMGGLIGEPLAYINEVPGIEFSEEIHGYRFGKYEIALGSSNILNNDYVLFRYADVLMMKAECLLRNGDADDAAVIVSKVRERAFKSNPSKATVSGADLEGDTVYDYGLRNQNTTTDEAVDDIDYGRFLDELGWEFNQEGRRRQDMIRFGVYTAKSWFSHSSNGDYRILFAIPQVELEKNPNLSKNPGY